MRAGSEVGKVLDNVWSAGSDNAPGSWIGTAGLRLQ